MEQADLTLVVADCADLPSDAQQAAAFLQEYLRSVLNPQEQPETGKISGTQMFPIKHHRVFALQMSIVQNVMYCDTSCSLTGPSCIIK